MRHAAAPLFRFTLSALLAASGWAAALPAAAQAITLAGRMGERALLVLEGRTVVLGVGQQQQGLKLLRWEGPLAVVQLGPRVFRLEEGGGSALAGSAAGAAPGGREIVIPKGSGGHYLVAGQIDGRPVRFMVDTGATVVAISRAEAERLGLDLSRASGGLASTAGGMVPTRNVTLRRVRVGEVEVFNVAASVVDAPMPTILLGNSFLDRFQLRRDNDVMRLELK